jgi:hypothetical protein
MVLGQRACQIVLDGRCLDLNNYSQPHNHLDHHPDCGANVDYWLGAVHRLTAVLPFRTWKSTREWIFFGLVT